MENYMILKLKQLENTICKLEENADTLIEILDKVEKNKAKDIIVHLGDDIHKVMDSLVIIKAYLENENDKKKIANNTIKIHEILEKLLIKKVDLGA